MLQRPTPTSPAVISRDDRSKPRSLAERSGSAIGPGRAEYDGVDLERTRAPAPEDLHRCLRSTPPPAGRSRRALAIALVGVARDRPLSWRQLPSLLGTRFAPGEILAAINAALAPGRLDVDRFELSWTGPTRLVGFKLIAPDGCPGRRGSRRRAETAPSVR